eukprot:GHVH01001918.1.p1 GENE.GHVH01001918.1~~GHVH01001918.1.p1  ORF type:complete len:674 (-),score=81.23 GHVH01001918.1:1973-3853(-)
MFPDGHGQNYDFGNITHGYSPPPIIHNEMSQFKDIFSLPSSSDVFPMMEYPDGNDNPCGIDVKHQTRQVCVPSMNVSMNTSEQIFSSSEQLFVDTKFNPYSAAPPPPPHLYYPSYPPRNSIPPTSVVDLPSIFNNMPNDPMLNATPRSYLGNNEKREPHPSNSSLDYEPASIRKVVVPESFTRVVQQLAAVRAVELQAEGFRIVLPPHGNPKLSDQWEKQVHSAYLCANSSESNRMDCNSNWSKPGLPYDFLSDPGYKFATTPGGIDSEAKVPKTIEDLKTGGYISNIPMAGLHLKNNRSEVRKHSFLKSEITPLVCALIQEGYDIRLGEKGRTLLKKEISVRFRIHAHLRESCHIHVTRLKNANVIQLLAMSEITGCLPKCLEIANEYWATYGARRTTDTGVHNDSNGSTKGTNSRRRSSTRSINSNLAAGIEEGLEEKSRKRGRPRATAAAKKPVKRKQRPSAEPACIQSIKEEKPTESIDTSTTPDYMFNKTYIAAGGTNESQVAIYPKDTLQSLPKSFENQWSSDPRQSTDLSCKRWMPPGSGLKHPWASRPTTATTTRGVTNKHHEEEYHHKSPEGTDSQMTRSDTPSTSTSATEPIIQEGQGLLGLEQLLENSCSREHHT